MQIIELCGTPQCRRMAAKSTNA